MGRAGFLDTVNDKLIEAVGKRHSLIVGGVIASFVRLDDDATAAPASSNGPAIYKPLSMPRGTGRAGSRCRSHGRVARAAG